MTPNGIVPVKWFTTQDSLYDLAWSEIHENQVLAGSGDGSIKLFDSNLNDFPVQNWKEHSFPEIRYESQDITSLVVAS
ncbi:peroxisomal targeting signal 2 receptor [Aspergillus melleus]|uniref:Peroxisomal targeting signal 2 receptor n=1 Tax=Aspergillus melleus TaxID=138277 RepID=A0ACC3AN65_9EURO|nr:peroxisomal targeting signal 2 receptor [Aspergillus melleus]